MSFTQFHPIIDRLINQYSCKNIIISGGEPTLHPFFSRMLSLLLQYKDLQISIATNGTTNNKYLTYLFNTYDNVSIQISLDGSSESVNALTRGGGNFQKAILYISSLAESAKKPVVKMTVSQYNYNDIENFFALAVSLGCTPDFDFINAMGNACDGLPSLELSPMQKLGVLRTINRLNKKYNINATLPYCANSCPLTDPDADHSVLIKPNNLVYPCQMLYSDKFSLGNILTDDEKTIYSSFRRVAEIVKRRTSVDYGCDKCPAQDFCKKGCMALADIDTDDPFGDDGECDFRKLQLLGFNAIEQGLLK
jgi:radical SAM additional 4Fe4S-binding domain